MWKVSFEVSPPLFHINQQQNISRANPIVSSLGSSIHFALHSSSSSHPGNVIFKYRL
ncbi:hypothetical protein DL98DRAFT_517586 [Cadophora sp. DSE1049]|nr:hypothetical protein DL98DRAFT_517586 [Cadophora sp. DSE1049]